MAELAIYEKWINNYTNHPSQPYAEFHRALTFDFMDNEAKAFNLFTNFTHNYSNDSLTPLALNWVADYHYSLGQFTDAEAIYKSIYQNTNCAPELKAQSYLMSGRSAFFRLDYKAARNHLTEFIENFSAYTNTFGAHLDASYFLLGDAMIELSETAENEYTNFPPDLRIFAAAIQPFERVSKTGLLGPRAIGRIGNCYLQLATINSNYYPQATNSYYQIITNKNAEIEMRSLARIGLGVTLQKMADISQNPARTNYLQRARNHYVAVFFDTERIAKPSCLFYVQQAGTKAAKLAENQGEFATAAAHYRRLIKLFPLLSKSYQEELQKLPQ